MFKNIIKLFSSLFILINSQNAFEPSNIISDFDNIVQYNNIFFAWTLKDNTLSIGAQTQINNCAKLFSVGFSSIPNQTNNSDVINASGDIFCNFNIDAFKLINNSYLLKQNYLIDKNVVIQNNTLVIKFSRLLNTGNTNDAQIVTGNNVNIIYSNQDVTTVAFYNFFNVKFLSNVPKNEILTYIEPVIISLAFFTIFILSLIVARKKSVYFKFLSKELDICCLNFLTIGDIIYISFYSLWWISMLIYSFVNKDEIILRLGLWIALNLAFVLLPISRNSLWVIFFNLSRDKLLLMHRFMSVLCLISVIVKFIAVLIFFPPLFLIKLINPETGGSPIAGTLSTFAIIFCSFLGVPIIRKNFFEIFYYSHRILSLLSIIFGSWHYVKTFYYVLPSILMYISDLIVRLVHTKKAIYSKIKHIGDKKYKTSCNVINITLKEPIKTYPGCYFFLCFYKDISRFQWHPLSLVSNTHDNLVFCSKNMGPDTWSGRLEKFTEIAKQDSNFLINKKVYIQGPYGTSLNTNYNSDNYKTIVLISGGIGITPMISIMKDIDELYFCRKMNILQKVVFIWIIPHESMIDYFKKYFLSVNKNLFKFKIYVTQKHNPDDIVDNDMSFPVFTGRPDIISMLTGMFVGTEKNLVLTCGPSLLTDDVHTACANLNVDMFCENF